MAEIVIQKKYDLEDRTQKFALRVRELSELLPKDIANNEDFKQLVRSSGSVGANYIEANESLSKKDFYLRIKICRKEAKESAYWLKLLSRNKESVSAVEELIGESNELTKIFGAIVSKQ